MIHWNAVNIKLYVYYFGDNACTGGVLDRQRQARPLSSNANGRFFWKNDSYKAAIFKCPPSYTCINMQA